MVYNSGPWNQNNELKDTAVKLVMYNISYSFKVVYVFCIHPKNFLWCPPLDGLSGL